MTDLSIPANDTPVDARPLSLGDHFCMMEFREAQRLFLRMEPQEYHILHDIEETYWWHVGRRNILRLLLSRTIPNTVDTIIDVGCGTGSDYALLKDFGKKVVGFDISEDALTYCRSRGWTTVSHIDPGQPLPQSDHSVDLITLFDVVEHVERDTTLLRDALRVLKPGGNAVITVPAYGWLWSEHDEALHHYRRYTLRRFVLQLREAGFDVSFASYVIVFSFPLVVLFRALKGVKNLLSGDAPRGSSHETSYFHLPKFLNSLFTSILTWEGKLLRWIRFPFGTSILIVATPRKEKTPRTFPGR